MNVVTLLIGLFINQTKEDDVSFAIIPFANEVTESQVKSIQNSLNKPVVPESQEDFGDVLVIRLGSQPMPDHLVKYHDCPRWVADLYKKDAKNLARIHGGYELQSSQKEWTDEKFQENWKNRVWGKDMTSEQAVSMQKYYRTNYVHYGRYKLLKVNK